LFKSDYLNFTEDTKLVHQVTLTQTFKLIHVSSRQAPIITRGQNQPLFWGLATRIIST